MEKLRCFNCHHTNLSHDRVFNVSEVRKSFMTPSVSEREILESDPIKQNGAADNDKENFFQVVCADCVYDRIQVCQLCYVKAPLCMFKVGEWFKERESRVCIQCSAAKDSQKLLEDGSDLNSLIHQCFQCGHFRYIQSFMISSKSDFDDIPRECLSCLLKSDIKQYKDDLHEKYESKLRQEPVLGNDINPAVGSNKNSIQPAAVLSYASVVTKGSSGNDSEQFNAQNNHSLNGEVGNDVMERSKLMKLTTFSAVINESICKTVLEALKFSFHQLEEKTKLELQLMQLDPQLCHGILRDKLIRVSHRFSKQGTQQTLFDDTESRWAYMGTYTVAHASLVLATLQSGILPPLNDLMKKSGKENRPQVCCFGAGPGSEVLGLSPCFPSDTQWILLDNCDGWEHLANVLLTKKSSMSFQYGHCDVSQKMPAKMNPLEFPYSAFSKAKLMMFVKFISAVQNLQGARKYLSNILKMASPGTMFLFIDNAHIQTKYFIEDLVFGSSKYVDNGDFKENDFYTLYTTYAELKSEDDGEKSTLMCEWVGYISYWLDRWPILDLRVNVLLAVKKERTGVKR